MNLTNAIPDNSVLFLVGVGLIFGAFFLRKLFIAVEQSLGRATK